MVEPIIQEAVSIPEAISEQLKLAKKSVLMENNTEALKAFLNSI